jgi:hypothetical protein
LLSTPFYLSLRLLLPEKAKSAIAFGVNFAAVDYEALRDGCFHFCHGAEARRRDVGGGSVAAVHYEGAFVHSCLGTGDEIEVMGAFCPGGVNVSSRVEDGF